MLVMVLDGIFHKTIREESEHLDTRVYPKCSDSVSEPRESLDCYYKRGLIGIVLQNMWSSNPLQVFLNVLYSFNGNHVLKISN